LCWDEVGERRHLRSDVVVQVVTRSESSMSTSVQHRIEKDLGRYNRRPLEFKAGEHVFLRISLTKRVIRFDVCGELSPRYICPFEILERVGEVAYSLALLPSLEGVHNVFHVSQLRRYVMDESHVLDYLELELQSDLSYTEQPMAIMDISVKILKNWTIPLVLVSWNRYSPGEATWEREYVIRDRYP